MNNIAHGLEYSPERRFAFGKNWRRFLKSLDESKIEEAKSSLQKKLECQDLKGKNFLDAGSGSGLFSLAAHLLGARVFSFDYDLDSVQCTKYLKERFGNNTTEWIVEKGSVLDCDFLKKFGQVDILYSWGVLHHTGDMYQAFANVAALVKDNCYLFISIYNDQGRASKFWAWVKKKYNKSNFLMRFFLTWYALFCQWTLTFAGDFCKTGNILKSWNAYGQNNRGMSAWYDVVDWVGGYPFEVAKPEEVFDFFKNKRFILKSMKTCSGGPGCNEFVFVKGT